MRNLWEWWKRIAKRVGDFQARIILILFYFLVLGPFALALRLGDDPLETKGKLPRGWRPKSEGQGMQMDRARSQF
jgi:hypothetical protein